VSLLLLVFCLSYAARFDEIDDAFIYARYISNALAGFGLVFNPGEHVNALSSPLFTYLLLGLSWILKGQVLLATKVLSATALYLACVLAELRFQWAGFLVASTGYFYSLVGMESSLFLLLLLAVVLLFELELFDYLPTALVLLLLTRFEGGILAALVLLQMFRLRILPRRRSIAQALLIVLMYTALNLHWYGTALPTSAGAKFGQGKSGYWGHWPWGYFSGLYQLKHDFVPTLYIVPIVVLCAVIGFRRLRTSSFNLLAVPFCLLLLSFYVLFNIPGYRWYSAPFIFFAMLYAASSFPASKKAAPWIAGLLLVMAATNASRFPRLASQPNYYERLGLWLKNNVPAKANIEADETGTVAYFCQCHVIDILGLTTPKNAVHIANRDPSSWLAEDRPDYIIVHDADWPYERVAKSSPDYERLPQHFDVVYVLRRKTSH